MNKNSKLLQEDLIKKLQVVLALLHQNINPILQNCNPHF